jgi:hypothetical protein
MTASTDLFADQGPEFAPQSDRLEVVAGKVVATMNKPSAVQKRFNTLMARIDAEQSTADALRRAIDTHGPVHRQAMHEFHSESQRLSKRMAVFLDTRIQAPGKPKGLTASQKQQAIRIVVSLCEQLASTQDAEVDALLQRYVQVDEDDENADADEIEQAQAFAESYLGGDFARGREFSSPEEVIRAAMEFEQKKMQAQADKRDAKRAERKAKKGLSAREVAAEQKQLDAQNALRTVYRQLASALHPDREPDAQARTRKTALMSEVNAAYERKDLSTLLRIQLQEEIADASKVAVVSEARLKAMCDLLAEQVKTLEMDNLHLRRGMEFDFGYAPYGRFSEAELLAAMLAQRDDVQEDTAHMRADLESVQDEKELKAWLKEQTRMTKAMLRDSQVFDLDDVLFSMMRRA